ncbi:MAG: hypothetical protein IPK67_04930 [Planctomycetes bacterium]|nr:hypothetical protein [Planctomycetota bacterium]
MSNQPKHPDPAGHGSKPAGTPSELHDDDAIVVPKGTSKLRFLFLLVLTILILVLFTVGDQLISSIGRPAAKTTDVVWDGPVVGKRVISVTEFIDEKRREDLFRGAFGARSNKFDDDELASELLLDDLAQRTGIQISVKDLARAIYEGFPGICPPMQNRDFYLKYLESVRVPAPVFEGVLMRKLRVERYQQFVRGATMVADTSKVESEWQKLNPQFAFDVIEVTHANFDAEAKASQPDEAGMRAWYDAIPDKRALFFADFLPASNAAEVVAYVFGGANTAEELIAKFPLPAETDAEQTAKDYYNQYSSVRFLRETPLPEGSPEAEGKDRLINSFEEVADLARRESRVLYALRAWVADIKLRKAEGKPLDLAAEAAALGLTFRPSDGAKSDADWTALADMGGPFLTRSIAGTVKDDFGADISVDRRAMTFPRVLEKNASAPPPYEKVAEKAVAEWLKQKTQELAVAKLTAVRDALPKAPIPEGTTPPAVQNPKADEAQFKAAAEAAGLVVERRDWMTTTAQNNDPEASKPSHEFLRFNGFLRNLPADEVSAVQQDRMRLRSYLVRSLGQREPPEVKLTPNDFTRIVQSLEQQSFEDFVTANFSPEALGQRYNLKVRGSTKIPLPEDS